MSRLKSVLLLFAAAGASYVQESRASPGGLVTDSSQAAVVGAKVRITNITTGVMFDTTRKRQGPVSLPVRKSRGSTV